MTDELTVPDKKNERRRKPPPAFRIPMTLNKAKANRAYQMLRDAAIERLVGENAPGRFSKDEILEATSLVGLEINWLILRDLLQKETGLDLYPVAAAYFGKRLAGDDPTRYLCQGHGKKCAGYIVAQESNGPAIKKILKTRQEQLNGGVTRFQKKVQGAEAHLDHLLAGSESLMLPHIADSDPK